MMVNKCVFILVFISVVFGVILFNSSSRSNFVVSIAADNADELIYVLRYFDSLPEEKQLAEYIIENMPGNYSYDTSRIAKYRAFLYQLDHLRIEQSITNTNPYDSINRAWRRFMEMTSLRQDIYSRQMQDYQQIKSDFLIADIKLAKQIWIESPYRDSVDFKTFKTTLLPYRKSNGYILEDWRGYFNKQYGQYLHKGYSIHQIIDSIMVEVGDYQVNGSSFSSYPYLSISDYNMGKISHCETRCWFNASLLSAIGIPCAVDFVPAWGNRNGAHEWNVLLSAGKIYPFEGIGGIKGKWKCAQVYNNVWVDEYWMKSRLPKVFRHTFESIQVGPSTNSKSTSLNTPAHLLNPKIKDVSDQYFQASDLEIPIKYGKPYHDKEYAYLFVFNNNAWVPVFWGVINNKKALFSKMGRDIVYLPGFYENGSVIPFNDPFILHHDGSVVYLKSSGTTIDSVVIERKYYERPDVGLWREWNEGAYVEIADNAQFNNAERIFEIPKCKSYMNYWDLPQSVDVRYIRYVFPEHRDVLAELKFLSEDRESLVGKQLFSSQLIGREVEKLFDDNPLSYADLVKTDSMFTWVGFDFGKKTRIKTIGVCPRNDENNIIKGEEYELFYWDNVWISLGRKIAEQYTLKYDNAPNNALLMIRHTSKGKENRIFTWENQTQKWW